MKNKVIFILLISMLLANCRNKSYEHPNFDVLPGESDISHSLDLESEDIVSVYDLLNAENKQLISSIKKDSTAVDLYGVHTIKSDLTGNVYYSRTGFHSIFIQNTDGVFKYSIGGEGRGPGEFNKLISFDFTGDYSRLIALDQSEVEVFSKNDNVYEFDYSIPLKIFNTKDLCVLENTLYYTGFGYEEIDSLETADKPYNNRVLTSGPVHAYDLDKRKELNSFGPTYSSYSGWWLLDAQLSDTRLACNTTTNTVVALLHNFGYFYGYQPNGSLKWISKLENFNYATLTEQYINTPQIRYSASPGGRFSPHRTTNSKYAIFQLANNASYPYELILDTGSGELLHGGSALPEMIVSKVQNFLTTIQFDEKTADGTIQIKIFRLQKE